MTGHRSDRGSATVELVLLAPVFTMLLAFVILVGRVEISRADIEGVAHSAARAITLSRQPDAAAAQARSDAAATLHEGSTTCRHMGWTLVDTSGSATVTITCTIDLAAASILPVPASYTVSASATEVFDHYREDAPS